METTGGYYQAKTQAIGSDKSDIRLQKGLLFWEYQQSHGSDLYVSYTVGH